MSDLIDICRYIGRRIPHWTQGPGGNVSAKFDGELWIKASGYRLDQIGSSDDFARMDLAGFRADLSQLDQDLPIIDAEAIYADVIMRHSKSNNKRPSMEAGFHGLLPATFVSHFHSLAGILMADLPPEDIEPWLCRNLPEGLKLARIEQVLPGYQLTTAIRRAGPANVFLLRNHGVVIASEQMSDIEAWHHLELAFCESFGFPYLRGLLNGELNVDELIDLACQEPCSPNIYFPDAMIYRDRVAAVLEPQANPYSFTLSRSASDHDALEIWLATFLLQRARPALSEFSEQNRQLVTRLATEKARTAKEAK